MSVSTPVKIEQMFSSQEIARRVAELGAEFRSVAGEEEVFILGILKGTICLAADLLRATPGPVSYGFVDVIRDVLDTETAAALEIDFLSFTGITGRNVFLLKDVVSSGVIETYLLSQLRMHEPKMLHLVALLDRPDLRTADLKADYRLFEAGAGSFVGYGLECDNHHGNLSYIGRI